METVIINGISAEKIKQVKFYIRIVSNRYQEDLQNVPEHRRNTIANHIVNFMRSLYLTDHPFDELHLINNQLIDAEHVVNYLYLPTKADLVSRISVSIDFDNMLSLSASNFQNYLTSRLALSDAQQSFVTSKASVIGRRYQIDSSRALEAPRQQQTKAIDTSASKARRNKRAVAQIDSDGRLIKVYESTVEAAKAMNLSDSAINNCLRGQSRQSGGYVWKYADEEKTFF